jgi:hypothetical protein
MGVAVELQLVLNPAAHPLGYGVCHCASPYLCGIPCPKPEIPLFLDFVSSLSYRHLYCIGFSKVCQVKSLEN